MRRGTLIGLTLVGVVGVALVAAGILPGWELILIAAALVLGVVFERSAYRRKPPADRRLRPTGEVFEDPVTGKTVKVLIDPNNGERYYDESEQ